jgi:GNAT superfamily N-acetyltransferase
MNFELKFERSVIPVDPSQSDALATVLSRAFYDGPEFRYIMPDDEDRLALLPEVFRTSIRASQLYGEIHTTPGGDGAALWIAPRPTVTPARMVRIGFLLMPLRLGWANFKRCRDLGERLDVVHQRLIAGPHWYLLALGVEPSKQGRGIGEALIEPVLARADSEGLPCYLETFNERNLPFYKRHAFQIAGGGNIPEGPDFWTMIRKPG